MKKKKTANRMSLEERIKVVAARMRGDSYTDISRRYGIARSTIFYWTLKMGVRHGLGRKERNNII